MHCHVQALQQYTRHFIFTVIIIIIIIDGQAQAWLFSVITTKQGFGPRTANLNRYG